MKIKIICFAAFLFVSNLGFANTIKCKLHCKERCEAEKHCQLATGEHAKMDIFIANNKQCHALGGTKARSYRHDYDWNKGAIFKCKKSSELLFQCVYRP